MKRTVLVTVVTAVMMCGTIAWSQDPGGPGGPGDHGAPGPRGQRGPMPTAMMTVVPPAPGAFARMAEPLALTEDQSAKLRDIATKSAEAILPLSKAATEASRALRDALLAPKYDAASVTELANKAQKAESSVISASIGAWTQIRSILTADQVTQLQEMMSRPPVRQGPGPQPGPQQAPGQ